MENEAAESSSNLIWCLNFNHLFYLRRNPLRFFSFSSFSFGLVGSILFSLFFSVCLSVRLSLFLSVLLMWNRNWRLGSDPMRRLRQLRILEIVVSVELDSFVYLSGELRLLPRQCPHPVESTDSRRAPSEDASEKILQGFSKDSPKILQRLSKDS